MKVASLQRSVDGGGDESVSAPLPGGSPTGSGGLGFAAFAANADMSSTPRAHSATAILNKYPTRTVSHLSSARVGGGGGGGGGGAVASSGVRGGGLLSLRDELETMVAERFKAVHTELHSVVERECGARYIFHPLFFALSYCI